MTGASEYFVHALARDAESTGELRLIGARLVRSQQGAAEVASGFVEAVESIERLSTQGHLAPVTQVLLALAYQTSYLLGVGVTATGLDIADGTRLVAETEDRPKTHDP